MGIEITTPGTEHKLLQKGCKGLCYLDTLRYSSDGEELIVLIELYGGHDGGVVDGVTAVGQGGEGAERPVAGEGGEVLAEGLQPSKALAATGAPTGHRGAGGPSWNWRGRGHGRAVGGRVAFRSALVSCNM